MSQATRQIILTRVFNVPRERVWQAWTDPEHVKCWWGPQGFTTPFYTIDLRVGGKYLNCMRSPEGEEYWSTGTYLEIVEGERLVSTDSFADKDGNIVPAASYGITVEWSSDAKIDVTLDDHVGKTLFTLKHSGVPLGRDGDLTEEGWKESFDRLEKCL
jgi:uncharacterized protein YndB with AHSA1/START domain